jgi:hypothetical protein
MESQILIPEVSEGAAIVGQFWEEFRRYPLEKADCPEARWRNIHDEGDGR